MSDQFNESWSQQRPQTSNSKREYIDALQQWLWQQQMWHQMNWMQMNNPFWGCMSMPHHGQHVVQSPNALGEAEFGHITPTSQQQLQRLANVAVAPRPLPGQQQVHTQLVQPAAALQRGREYTIPSLGRRIGAEFIDFFLLFMVKLGVTILFVEYVGLLDIQKYDIENLLNHNLDYNTAFAMTSELVAMEIINRILICIFETLCLYRGIGGTVGGTTPGKRILGLRVVACEEISDLPGNKVRVIPANDIGFWNALVRSVIKNFSLAFFFPVCFTVFFFQHNRAAYDIIANCIVVEIEDNPWH